MPYVVERIVAQGEEVNKRRVFIPTGASGLLTRSQHHSPLCNYHHHKPSNIRRSKEWMTE